jgi:hypothetical protein
MKIRHSDDMRSLNHQVRQGAYANLRGHPATRETVSLRCSIAIIGGISLGAWALVGWALTGIL